MKPKANHKESSYDLCQTPAYALDPLLPYLDKKSWVWEPANGEGILSSALRDAGFTVISTDILTGHNFFEYEPYIWSVQITNPSYSIKYDWLKHSYELNKPFALLMPVEMLGAKKAQDLFKQYGINVILLSRRVNFKMPNKGWTGTGAQFPVAWYTWRLGNLTPNTFRFGEINYPTKDQL